MRQQSALRTMLGFRTIAIGLVVLALVSAVGFLFYLQGRRVMEEQLKERLRTTAAVAAQQFAEKELSTIHDAGDEDTAVFKKTVAQLNAIRDSVPGIRFAYIMRRTETPTTLLFVADADSLAPASALDTNGNGTVDDEEKASHPGDAYDATGVPPLQGDAFLRAASDDDFTYDQWGATISGYAPIPSRTGEATMLLGLDMDATEYLARAQQIFSPVALLLLLLAGLLLAAYAVLFATRRRIETMQELDTQRTALMQLTTHQLGAPIATLKWWMEIHREHTKNEPGHDEKDEMTMLKEGVDRIDAIMKALQEAYQVFSGEIEYKLQEASLKQIIEDVTKETVATSQSRKQKIILNIETAEERMKLDPKLVAAVVRELLDNAMTYSPEGSTVTVRALRRHNDVEVQVQDEGHGIPAKDLPHIFERFTRGSNAYQFKPVGNGLGLFTAKGIVERSGGKMWIESEEGSGTTVSFTLPIG